jgi:replicative DNA helicase
MEIEQTVIGCLILDYKGCGDVAKDVMPGWFCNPLHQEIMTRITQLREQNITPDSMTIIDRLSDEAKHEVLHCAQLVPSISNFPNYVDQLRQAWRTRTVQDRIQGIALEGVTDVDETIEELRAIVKEQDEIVASCQKEVGIKFMDAAAGFYTELYNDATRHLTGFPMFDKTLGGLLPGTVLALAARSGQGKTDFAVTLMMRFAARGLKIVYYSMEMTRSQILTRISAQMTGINNTRIRDRDLSQQEKQDICKAFGAIQGSENIRLVEDKPGLAVLRQNIRAYKPDIVFIDHLGLFKMPKRKSRVEEVSETTRALHDLALETGVAIVELVQMNREIEKRKSKRPVLSDLKESGTIEEDSDYVVFLQANKGDQPLTGNDAYQSFAFIEKNRHGGTGVVRFAWRPQYSRYAEVDGIHEYGR